MKMTNKNLLELNDGLHSCGELKGIKFTFAVAKNLNKISGEINVLLETVAKLQRDYSEKDAKGNPIIIGNKFQIPNMEEFNAEHKKLMDEEIEIDLHMVKKDDIPEDISAKQMSGIFAIISEK